MMAYKSLYSNRQSLSHLLSCYHNRGQIRPEHQIPKSVVRNRRMSYRH
nr:MAG TPA: hypothetical protein [Caudoviricetes sp.]